MKPHPKTTHRLGLTPVALAIVYLAGTSLYAVLGFRNFSWITVLLLLLLFASLPLGLISVQSRVSIGNSWRESLKTFARVSPIAFVLFLFQFSGLARWSEYYINFANHRISSGGGFFRDTAFHVAIIQGILNTGYPTTGQHLEPFARYHTLSHYFDAGVVYLFGLDAWESYALLFFAKGVLLTLCLIYFAARVSRDYGEATFWTSLTVGFLAFTSTWVVIASHGQWVPMVILALIVPWVYSRVVSGAITLRLFLVLSAVVVVLSFGKVSLGFSFALFVGLWIFFLQPRNILVWVFGVSWAAYFYLFSQLYSPSFFGNQAPQSLWERLDISWREIYSLAFIALLLFVSYRVTRSRTFASSALAVIGILVIFLGITVALLGLRWDVFYFFHGAFSVVVLFVIPLTLSAVFRNREAWGFASNGSPVAGQILAVATSLLLVVSPVTSKELVSPYHNLDKIAERLDLANGLPYKWLNVANSNSPRMTVFGALTGQEIKDPLNQDDFVLSMKRQIADIEFTAGVKPGTSLLFFTSDQYAELGALLNSQGPRFTGLAITAITGHSLVFGVNDSSDGFYGFLDYGRDSELRPSAELDYNELCQFERVVIRPVSLNPLAMELACPR